jgi:hypothetical protein
MSKTTSIAEAAAAIVGGGKTGGSHSANPVATGAAGLPNSKMGSGDKTAGKSATPDESDLTAQDTPNDTNVKPTKTSETNKASLKTKPSDASASMKEDLDAMFNGVDLTEDFKEKASVIFETAVNSRVESIKAELEEEFDSQLNEAVKVAVEDLVENVDSYLNYVAEKWLEDNILQVESTVRTDLTNSFMTGLKELFTEHYVDIPEDKVDVVSELADKVAKLEERLNEEVETNVKLNKQISEATVKNIVAEETENLADTQKAKIQSLSEGISYNDVDDFRSKLKIIVESYINSPKSGNSEKLTTDAVELTEEKSTSVSTDPLVAHFARYVGNSIKK